MGSSVPYNTQQQQQRRQQQQLSQDNPSDWQQSPPQQRTRNSSSSSSSSSYWSRPSSSSSSSDSSSSFWSRPAQPNEVLSSAIDKLYKQRLRQVKAMLASGSLEELTQDLTPEQQESLQVVLQDLQVIGQLCIASPYMLS
jgi:hypothetical protein